MTDRELYLQTIAKLEAQKEALLRIVQMMVSTPNQTPMQGRGKNPYIIRHAKDNPHNDKRKN